MLRPTPSSLLSGYTRRPRADSWRRLHPGVTENRARLFYVGGASRSPAHNPTRDRPALPRANDVFRRSAALYSVDQPGLIPSISRSLERDHAAVGRLFETFVVMELLRQAGWQDEPVRLFHYRDKDGREVDLILERRDGAVIGVEAKAAASVGPSDFRGLTRM